MQKLLPIILTVLYFVNSKYLLVKTEIDEGAKDYQGGEAPRDYSLDENKGANDYKAAGSDYNMFLRKVSKDCKVISTLGWNSSALVVIR